MKKLKVDERGYQKLLRAITEAELELHNLRYYSGKDTARTKRWYDDADNYQHHLKEQMVQKKINMLREQIENCEIVKKSDNKTLVDLDDIIKLDVSSSGEREEMLIKLVGGIGDFKVSPTEISINSPLGQAIYQKEIGDNTYYNVENEFINVVIKEKIIC